MTRSLAVARQLQYYDGVGACPLGQIEGAPNGQGSAARLTHSSHHRESCPHDPGNLMGHRSDH